MNLSTTRFNRGREHRVSVAALILLILPSVVRPVNAQETQPAENPPPTPPGGSQQLFASPYNFVPREGNRLRLTATADYSYVAAGDANFQALKPSGSAAQSLHVALAGAVPVDEHWFVPLGLSSGNLWLDSAGATPIPAHINTLRLLTGLGYRLNDQWTFTASLGPSLYRLEDVDADDFGIAGTVGALYRVKPGLTFSFGIGFSPDSDIPVLPAAGVRWDIQTNLTLNLMFPRPVLIYRLSPGLSVFVGGDFKSAVFRADENLGDKIGQPAFNNALGTYHDFHVGLGIEYELQARLSFTLEGGYSVGRRVRYTRIDQSVSFDPSPYCQAGVKYRF